jgi:hypothetical protein
MRWEQEKAQGWPEGKTLVALMVKIQILLAPHLPN